MNVNRYTFFNFKYFSSLLIVTLLGMIPAKLSANAPVGTSVLTTETGDKKRYFSLMLLNLTRTRGPEVDIIRMGHDDGMNAVYLTIPWGYVYYNSPTDAPDWANYDEQIKTAVSLGMKVAIRIHVGRSFSRIKGFWEVKDCQQDGKNLPMISGYGDTSFRFNHEPSVQKAAAFVKEVVDRYKYLQKDNNLLFISVTNTPEQEAGFNASSIYNGKQEDAAFDYSPEIITGFRQWLLANYKKIERLNYLWGTSYKSFNEASAPTTPWEPRKCFGGRYGKDWYIYRHIVLKGYLEKMISTVKSVDPAIKYVVDYGSVFDDISAPRGTMAFKNMNEKADGLKVNDGLNYTDHRFSIDVIKSEAPANFFIANEVFYTSELENYQHSKQIDENYENGAEFVCVVLSTIASMQRAEPMLRESAAKWADTPLKAITYADSVGYRLSTAIEKSNIAVTVHDAYTKIAYADPKNPKPVHVHLEEDLFTSDYWKEASNHPPYVFRPIPMQVIAVNKDYSYKLPIDTFSDVDGTIVKTTVSNLPSWLTYDGNVLKGRPTVMTDYRILVQGIDDEGGVSDAYFTIRVDTRENANKPPVVNSNFSNQLIAVKVPFLYSIPKDAFTDADGEVTKIEVTELPAWLKYSNGVMSGTPPVTGSFRVFVKAYDDLNAFVETYFTINVVEPQFLNIPPFVNSPIPIKYVNVNKPFTYLLPNIVFGDADGYISSISIQNRPSWLEFAQNVFSGTPPEEGEYRLIVRAYDNLGAYIETTFILRVEIPKMRFELVRGGRKVDQQIIRALNGEDVIASDVLPPLLNIYAYGNFDYDKVHFDLNGPYRKQSETSVFPYALYEGETGFAPYVGRYTLTVKATNKDSAVVTNSIQFSISAGDSINITKNLEAWQFYPNPIESIINIKLPDNQPADQLEFVLITNAGRVAPISSGFITIQDQLANIDLSSMGVSSGIYFIQVKANGEKLSQFKIFKR
jgi:hypothetical protein